MNVERILVRGTNWIGDAVMTTPALQRLRSSFPDSRITLLATPLTAGLFAQSRLIDEVIEYRRREEGAGAFFKTAGILRERRFDLAALFQNAFEAALLARLGGIKLRVGFDEQGRGFLLTHKLSRGPQHRNRHQINDYIEIVAECERICLGEGFNPPVLRPLPLLVASDSQREAASSLLKRLGIEADDRPLVVLNAGATNSRAKCWPADRFASIADRLSDEMNSRIALIGGPSEVDYSERVAAEMKKSGAVNLAGKTSMAELIGLLSRCDLLISNDTGPAHIGAALGRPTLTIFGPTNEFETAPAGPFARLIRADGIECARCMHKDCPIDHRCMTRLPVDSIYEIAREMLGFPLDVLNEAPIKTGYNNR